MAIGTIADFKIYNEEFHGGLIETVEQFSDAFNEASGNAIRLVGLRKKGQYEKESFVKAISSLVTRRDVSSTSSATALKAEHGEKVSVKVNRKIGPVDQTLDAFRKIGAEAASEMSLLFGQMSGKEIAVDYVDTSLAAVNAAISNVAALEYDATSLTTKTLTTEYLVRGLAKMGDASSKVTAWVMHSKPFFDLMESQITDKIFGVSNVAIFQGSIGTLGRPIVVVDSPSLVTAGSPDEYQVLGLVEDAVVVTESEERQIVSDMITGNENLIMRMQGEYAFNLGVKGFAWDIANGGANPADAAIATGTNWDKIAADNKSLPGVRIIVQ